MQYLQQMKLFTTIVETGSFSRAAELLDISNGAASRQIKALEQRLGTYLLLRSTRKVELTSDGQIFYEKCITILSDINALDSLFMQDVETISGVVRVGMPLHTAEYVVIPQLLSFHRQYPHIQIEITAHDGLSNPLIEGLDCMIHLREITDGNYFAKSIYSLRQVSCASPAYLAHYGMPQHLKDLSDHRLIHLKSSPYGFEYCKEDNLREPNYWEMPTALSVNTLMSVTSAAQSGIGIAQTFRALVQPLLQRGELVEVLPNFPPALKTSFLLYPHKTPPQRVQVFIRWLLEAIENFVADVPESLVEGEEVLKVQSLWQ